MNYLLLTVLSAKGFLKKNISGNSICLFRLWRLCLLIVASLFVSATTFAFTFEAPKNLKSQETTGTNGSAGRTIEWTWDPVPGRDHYNVFIDGVKKNSGKHFGNSFVSRNLYAPKDYSLRVESVFSWGNQRTYSSKTLAIHLDGNSQQTQSPTAQTQAQNPVNTSTSQPSGPGSVSLDISTDSQAKGLIDPNTSNHPEAGKAGLRLVFSDEFDGDMTINKDRWKTQVPWDGDHNGDRYEYRTNNGENQFYVNIYSEDANLQALGLPNPFEFPNGGNSLGIRAHSNRERYTGRWADMPNPYGKLSDVIVQHQFLSGVISTHDKFKRKYGWFEARIKLPNSEGTFPAFWLMHQTRQGTLMANGKHSQRSEIDIMEHLGHASDTFYNAAHYYTGVTETSGGTHVQANPSPTGQIKIPGKTFGGEYHTYAVKWEQGGRITYFVDGIQTSQVNNSNFDHEELYIIINLAMGGNWNRMGTDAGAMERRDFPTDNDFKDGFTRPMLEVDYVRAYEFSNP